jgi:hypothetical protein
MCTAVNTALAQHFGILENELEFRLWGDDGFISIWFMAEEWDWLDVREKDGYGVILGGKWSKY